MHMHSLNWLAILVAAISPMILGFLWSSPLLFAKPRTHEMGYDLNDKAKMEECARALDLPTQVLLSPASSARSLWR